MDVCGTYNVNIYGDSDSSRVMVWLPLQVIDFVCVLSLLSVLFVGFILQDLHPLPSTRLILTGLGHRVQLAHLVLEPRGVERES